VSIPFYDFDKLHNQKLKDKIKTRFSEIIDNNNFIEGKYNTSFENEFAKMQQAKHCLLVANGTDALEISLIASGVKQNEKVGIPGITFFATAEAVINIGAIPVLIDVFPETGLMDPESLNRIIKKHDLKAIIPVHIYGLPAPILKLEKICFQNNIKIIEDGAQASGTMLSSGPVGSSSNLTTFSFYPTKNLSAFGDAGAILTQSDEMASLIKSIRNHGRGSDGLIGRNSRCDHLQAAVLHLKLETISDLNSKRKEKAKQYHQELSSLNIKLLPKKFLDSSSWHLYPILLSNKEIRDELHSYLKQSSISNVIYYQKSMAQETALSELEGEFEQSNIFSSKVLCLPIHPFIEVAEIKHITGCVKSYLENH